jgi:hypothetical protein
MIDSTIKEKEIREQLSANIGGIITADDDQVESSPWLRRTNWMKQFEGKDMNALIQLTNMRDGTEAGFTAIKKSVLRIITKCLDGVWDCDRRGWQQIRFWLYSHDKLRAHEKPFRKDYRSETVSRYASWWSQLIWFCYSAFNVESETEVELLQSQQQAVHEIHDILIS